MSLLDRYSVTGLLNQACRAAGGQSAFAAQIGVSRQYIGRVLSRHAEPGQKILDALNLKEVKGYVRTNGPQSL